MYEDQTLTCGDCGAAFTFTAGEQEFYASKDLSAPKRCNDCRQAKRATRQAAPRQDTVVNCGQCGAETTVPFVPNGSRPVLCRDCFAASRAH